MDVAAKLTDLPEMHPELIWGDIVAAAASVLSTSTGASTLVVFELTLENMPETGDDPLRLRIQTSAVPVAEKQRIQRTFDASRLIELAAIAITGLGIYHASGLEIRDVARRGTGADYLVGCSFELLEIAGRSRRSDVAAAWQERWSRLERRCVRGFYLSVVEFEFMTGRLAYHASSKEA